MGLRKPVELDNGVTVSYHRVVSVNTITNVQNTIEIASYTSEKKREEELEALANGGVSNVFISTRYVSAPYDQAMTVQGAYQWIASNVEDLAAAEPA